MLDDYHLTYCPVCGSMNVESFIIIDVEEGRQVAYMCGECKLSIQPQFSCSEAIAVWTELATRIENLKGGQK